MGSPVISCIKGPYSLELKAPHQLFPWMVSSVSFSSLSPNPNKTHQLLQNISGLCFFVGRLLFFFFISNTEKVSWALWGSPRSWPPFPTLTALLPTANLFQGQHFFQGTININCVLSLLCRTRGTVSICHI